MEIEKPFKCPTCSARFTNEDHLSVHRRRHEMSLNLKSELLGQPSHQPQSLDSFVDETPTPTRFFRNCEEVGLFQDLQNVNPFDESFAKASRTPSTGPVGVDQFDFSVALPSSATVVQLTPSSESSDYSLTSKRRYSDQDTLNTPQVFLGGYNLSSSQTATNFSSTTTTVLNPVPSGGPGNKVLSLLRTEGIINDNQNPQEELNLTGGIKSQRPKTSLKLNLSPITPIILSPNNVEFQKLKDTQEPEKKTELLERNRAAASRSRQRRKQWVYTLESRCETLEKQLAEARAENQTLRTELAHHANCDVTKSQNMNEVEAQVQKVWNQTVITEPKLRKSSIITTDIIIGDESSPSLLISKPKMPAKRGRPRKGQERRVQGFSCFITTPSITTPAKLPLLPLTSGLSTDE